MSGLKRDQQILVFTVLGCALILFPDHIVKVLHWVAGITLIIYACVNLFLSLRFPDAKARPGQSLLHLAVGIVVLLLREQSLGVIGVIWAMLSLEETAEEINEYYHTRQFSLGRLIWLVITVVLAILLMHDPFEHFVFHMRILGLEMIATAFVRWRGGTAPGT